MGRSGDDAPGAACLTESRVIEFISGSVGERERQELEEHLDGCGACFDWVAQLVRASLVTSHRGYADTLPLGDSFGTDSAAASLAPGQIVGRYQILEPLGRGAMGVVFRALDTLLQRPVALKVIRGARPSTAVKLRALREAQALAKLDHPNAVGVHDIGFFGDDVFVAMELVDGETLADWLGRERRSWRAIRDVFLQAGRGLAAAHAAGLIHRDFKPDNVLLSGDGRRVVVTDFGLVCSLDVEGERGDGEVAGTPAYMAPEQFQGGPADVRTDVFNFCACLYEALFGCSAFPGITVGERRRAVLAGEARRPPADAHTPRWLARLLMRGLSRAPDDRPASMAALMSEMERDRRARRRVVLAGTLGLVVALLAITAGVTSYRNPAAACRRRGRDVTRSWSPAIRQRLERAFSATGATFAARMQESVAGALQAFIERWSNAYLDTCDATYRRGAQSLEAFDERVACLDAQRDGFDRLVERLQTADRSVVENAAQAAFSLDEPERCVRERLSTTLMVPPHLKSEVEATRRQLRDARTQELIGKYDEAARIATAALPRARTLAFSPLVAEAWERIGVAERYRGRSGEAEEALRAAFDAAERSADDAVRARAATELVNVVGVRLGRAADGEHWSELADAILTRLGDPELDRATLLMSRGLLRETEGKLDLAEADFAGAYELRRRRLPASDPLVPLALGELAIVAYDKGNYEAAGAMLRQTYALLEGSVGATHPTALAYRGNLGSVEFALGHYREARAIWKDVRRGQESALGPAHPNVIATLDNIVAAELALGDYDAAKSHAEEVLALATRGGNSGPQIAHYDLNLAFACSGRGEYDEARRYALDALARREAQSGRTSPLVGHVELQLAQLARDAHRWADVRAHGERALELLSRAYGVAHVEVATALDTLGVADCELGDAVAAVEKHERAVRIFRGAKHRELPIALTNLGRAQLAAGRKAAAVATLEEAQRLRQTIEGDRQERAATSFALARAIAGAEPRRATALATTALDGFAAGGPRFRDDTLQVRHWLEQHH